MIFGKNKKELCLSDYKDIWSKFCFLDESGNLNNAENNFFTIGIIKCSQPYYLYSKLLYERNKRNFHDEMKFNKISKNNIDFIKFAIEAFLDTKSIYFYSYTVDKSGVYFKNNYDNNQWVAYEEISIKLLESAVIGTQGNEIIILIADHVTTPKNVKYEVNVKNNINRKQKRLSVAGVCRFDSKGNDLLQVVDLFIGAINYDLKTNFNLVSGDKHKKDFVNFIKQQLGVASFLDGYRDRKFNIFVDKDVKQRLKV
ncbi:MAG: hypothetical protein A2224_03710 [Candidatus Magasanikbacteria bacterium RIFOXYA2_FULL_40_20]|nr:MAG: hypothetical protein A2224_03710 [Candidatus Magasanikbacteria bacterium RIFOXYA2_FULL_40_20]